MNFIDKKLLWIVFLLFFFFQGAMVCAGDWNVKMPLAEICNGKCFPVRLVSAEGIVSAEISFLGKKIPCFREGNDFAGIAAVPLWQKPGSFEITLSITNANGSREEISRSIRIAPTHFPRVSFWLKPAKKKLLDRPLARNEWAKIEPLLLSESDEKKWEGKFILPATGEVSMYFGVIEKINNVRRGQHMGFDIAVPIGTPVRAANSGKIVFADKLKVFGGTVVIDHGRGIHSLYFHLSKLFAKIGDEAKKGDTIALSGNSGVSSGPHLHWGMSVHNLRVDPLQWAKVDF